MIILCKLLLNKAVSISVSVSVSYDHSFLQPYAHSQHCLPASVEARELNLKCDQATSELNPGTYSQLFNH